MIIANSKPIRIIGYNQGSSAQEFSAEIKKTHNSAMIVEPDEFLKLKHKQSYQYIVSEWKDSNQRAKIIEYIDQNNFDLITVIHDTAVIGQMPVALIGHGSFVFPFCNLSIHSQIGKHCVVGSYSLIGHYSKLGDNCILRPGVMINGKSSVGNNCVLNTRVTVTNNCMVEDNIKIMAFSNVTKNLTDPGEYIGSPARKIRSLNSLNVCQTQSG